MCRAFGAFFQAHFTPAITVLWRLVPRFWGRGLAMEAARGVLDIAFQTLNLAEIVAFAAEQKPRSMRVMERLGMNRDHEQFFDHPAVADSRLRLHALYRARP